MVQYISRGSLRKTLILPKSEPKGVACACWCGSAGDLGNDHGHDLGHGIGHILGHDLGHESREFLVPEGVAVQVILVTFFKHWSQDTLQHHSNLQHDILEHS